MANIPGTSGVLPGTYARDQVISNGVSIPGGLRVVCIMGEGLREEVIVSQAVGGGADGVASISPSGLPEGRYFKLQNYPVISGRTQLYLNDSILYGVEDVVDSTTFSNKYDYRVDPATGYIELHGAFIRDQDGKNYSASSLNVGNGTIADGTCGDLTLISVVDDSAPGERWTIRAVSVIRDSNGDPIPGRTVFTVTGSVSGQLRDSNGQPYLFHDSYFTGSAGAVSGNADACTDGFTVASSSDFGAGTAIEASGDATADTTYLFQIDGDLISQGQALVGDELCIDGYVGIEIEDIEYDSDTDKTTVTLVTDSLSAGATDLGWEIRASNLFVDDPSVTHNGLTGSPATAGSFKSSDVGKILMICSGTSAGIYTITKVTSSRRVRVQSYNDSTVAFPTLADDNSDGLGETGLTFSILETNGVLMFGIKAGSIPFETGDKFYIDVDSNVLKANDHLIAYYIAELDLNDPEFFTSGKELNTKHGNPSTTNTLSLGAQLAFENGAPGILALQTKPAVPRRTSITLLEEVTSAGVGGFRACGGTAADCQVDDLEFIITRNTNNLIQAKPAANTQVNIFVVRSGVETQIFPNKVDFYNSQYESATGKNNFITSSDTSYSYTIINTDTKIDGVGNDGIIDSVNGTFSTLEYDFDGTDVGKVIVVQSLEDADSAVLTTTSDISTYLFGNTTSGVELVIVSVTEDGTVTVTANDDSDTELIADATEVQFFIKDLSDTTNVQAALLLHKDLVGSGTLKTGDGIKISYIDTNDADFYDTNWFSAFESLEREDCQIVVPLPLQNRSGIFRMGLTHCNTMSSITIQKERVTFFGAQQGLTTAALIGTTELAIEDVGILEGIQGDDVEEVLAGNTEDLVNYKLSDNYDDKRAMYFYPDKIVRSINGTNTYIDGFYMAAAAAGWFSGTTNIALPLTNKTLTGFTILRDKKYRPTILKQLTDVGAVVLQPVTGGGKVIQGRSTSHSGYVEDEEMSIVFIRDYVKKVMRDALRPYIGGVDSNNTQGILGSRARSTLAALVAQNVITDFKNVRIERDKIDPRQWNVYALYQPVYPISFIFIDLYVGII